MKFNPRKNPDKPNINIKNLLKGSQVNSQTMKQYPLATTNGGRKLKRIKIKNSFIGLVRMERLELSRIKHRNLNPRCLPIPPHPHIKIIL